MTLDIVKNTIGFLYERGYGNIVACIALHKAVDKIKHSQMVKFAPAFLMNAQTPDTISMEYGGTVGMMKYWNLSFIR